MFVFLCVCVCVYRPPPGRGVKVEDILKDDETLTSYLLRDVRLTESVVFQLVNAQIRAEEVRGCHMNIQQMCVCLYINDCEMTKYIYLSNSSRQAIVYCHPITTKGRCLV